LALSRDRATEFRHGRRLQSKETRTAGPSPMLEYAFFEGRIVLFADAKISVWTHAVQ
jgi:hypothetical protein